MLVLSVNFLEGLTGEKIFLNMPKNRLVCFLVDSLFGFFKLKQPENSESYLLYFGVIGESLLGNLN